MAYYLRVGDVPPKRHTEHRAPSGELYYEELMGEEGFSSDSSLLYHMGIPAAVTDVRSRELPDQSTVPNQPLAPRHLKPVPYYHSNVDSDEVMFYCGGDYEARKGSGIGQGSVSPHPAGHAHGPQPGAVERSLGARFFDEPTVMVDTFRPLELGEAGRTADDGEYVWSWSGRRSSL
ncbi:homogentisate 1,2-dioxygenase domain-containing protein [Microbispora sp. NPDC046933]|uniref:homogentisate 1,2-dioxygenase domain-containing protein n=1 Tax=Microbispora sp. NPDC046933 TaxID=3155618 RepID=UPI0033D188A0